MGNEVNILFLRNQNPQLSNLGHQEEGWYAWRELCLPVKIHSWCWHGSWHRGPHLPSLSSDILDISRHSRRTDTREAISPKDSEEAQIEQDKLWAGPWHDQNYALQHLNNWIGDSQRIFGPLIIESYLSKSPDIGNILLWDCFDERGENEDIA